jgi:hypothetical protein
MEINKFLQIIDVPVTDEKQATDFISRKSRQIEDCIRKLRDEYYADCPVKPENTMIAETGTVIPEQDTEKTQNSSGLLTNNENLNYGFGKTGWIHKNVYIHFGKTNLLHENLIPSFGKIINFKPFNLQIISF